MDIERASEHDLITASSAEIKSLGGEAKHRVASAMWVENYANEAGRLSTILRRFRQADTRARRRGRLADMLAIKHTFMQTQQGGTK